LEVNINDVTVEEALQMIKHMQQMHEKMNREIEELIGKSGWGPKYSKDYLENPNNFDSVQWEEIQSKRKEFMTIFKTPKELREEEERAKKTPLGRNQKSDSKPAKERRRQSTAARRKWLPMR
jgi:hypothetical protein